MSTLGIPAARMRTYSSYELLGVAIENNPARASAVRLRVEGIGLESHWELLDAVEKNLPEELAETLQRLNHDSISTLELASLSTGLTAAVANLTRELLVDRGENPALALGLTDPGCWQTADGEVHGYTSLCDAAALAESLGVSIIDAFPARDLALSGRGGPLDSLPLWLLLHNSRRAQLIIDIQDSTHLTYLPASCEASGAARMATFGLGPGLGLLANWPTEATTGDRSGKSRSEIESRLAAWLISAWNFAELKWSPTSAHLAEMANNFAEFGRLQGATLEEAEQAVCVALVHFLTQNVATRVPRHPPLGQIVFARENFISEGIRPLLSEKLSDVLLTNTEDLGWPSVWLGAACSAALAMLHIEQVPTGGTLQTGSSAARVLGRLTPGTPANWRRLLKHLSDNQPTTMSLRSAI